MLVYSGIKCVCVCIHTSWLWGWSEALRGAAEKAAAVVRCSGKLPLFACKKETHRKFKTTHRDIKISASGTSVKQKKKDREKIDSFYL